MSRVLTIVLAGGKGERLQPLTRDRAKPAVPFAGTYRIIDFTLSNCIHSGLRQILVLTQYKSQSLDRHLRMAWSGFHREWGEYLEVVPPQQRVGERWYSGTADAVHQNLYALEQVDAEHVLLLSGDHVYRMDYRDLLRDHVASGADATVCCVPVPLLEGRSFGVMQIDDQRAVRRFDEKPLRPKAMPDDPQMCLASMGVYVFQRDFLIEQLKVDELDANSPHDFGRSILPRIIGEFEVRAYPFRDPTTGESGYWRDVGTPEAYFEANMDLLSDRPGIVLHDPSWRFHTYLPPVPPAMIGLLSPSRDQACDSRLHNSIVGPGSVITDACLEQSVLSSCVRVDRDAEVRESVLLDNVHIGANCCVRRAVIDKNVRVPDGAKIGFDAEWDRERGLTVTESGLVLVPKGFHFSRPRRPHAWNARDVVDSAAAEPVESAHAAPAKAVGPL